MSQLPYSIRLTELEAAEGTIPIRALRDLCDILIKASARSLRLAVEGTSTPKGKMPHWVKQSVDFTVTQLREGSTVIDLRAPTLGETAFEEIRQHDLWQPLPAPEDTALSVLARAVQDIQTGTQDSDRYDLGVLKSLSRFEKFIHAYHANIELYNGAGREPIARIGASEVERISSLEAATPKPRAVVVAGMLEVIEHSRKAFKLITEGKVRIPGRIQGEVSAEDLRSLWGRKVTVKGQAHYTPSGRMRLIEADLLRPFEEHDALFERVLRAQPRSDVPAQRGPRPRTNFLNEIWDTWPGDESIDELLADLAEGSASDT